MCDSPTDGMWTYGSCLLSPALSRFPCDGEFFLRLVISLSTRCALLLPASLPSSEGLITGTCASMAAPKLLVEYAKSSRSSCKVCSKNIAAGSLRLGLSTKDPRGFDMVKWHHLNCHPTKSHPLGATEEIKGFSSLKVSRIPF